MRAVDTVYYEQWLIRNGDCVLTTTVVTHLYDGVNEAVVLSRTVRESVGCGSAGLVLNSHRRQ